MKNLVPLMRFCTDRTNSFQNKGLEGKTGSIAAILLLIMMTMYGFQSYAQWTDVATPAPNNNLGSILLLSDGRAFCKSDGGASGNSPNNVGKVWNILTPDIHGSYVNGTWSSAAPMISQRYSAPADILMNGKVYAAGGEYGTDGTQNGWHAEVYDPVVNTWTACLGTNSSNVISDGNSVVLYNGTILQSLVNQPFPTATVVYNPLTNTFTAGPSSIGGQNESMWLKLPDSSILMVDEGALTSERFIPSMNAWVADGDVPVAMYDQWGEESGPALMLPDGRAIFFSSLGYSAYYTPSGTTSPGTWATGPSIPNGNGMPDAPAAMMQNGLILLAASPVPTANNEFNTPTYFYTFDYTTNTYTAVNAPTGGASYNGISQQFDLLNLPNGQVLCSVNSDNTSQTYHIYTPTGPVVAAGKPIVSSVTAVSCTEYMAYGQKFNGISQGSAFGDENQNDTNYPIIKLTSGTSVYYCRTHDWNSSNISTGTRETYTGFTLPSGIPAGNYNLFVIANGIASDSIPFTVSIPSLSSSVTPPSVCSGSPFTYTPTSINNTATFTWTRAAVTGISNAAITTPQTSNPNEVLINTTNAPITVVYTYAITDTACNNTETVSVIVNPPPTASFTTATTTSCHIPDSVSFTNNSIAGSNYVWNFGDGDTSSAMNPLHLYLAGGSFTVKLITSSACGVDSSIQSNYIVINPPVAPTTASSPDTIPCGSTTTLTASSSDSMKWFDQLIGGNLLATGGTYTTPPINSNTIFYVESDVIGMTDSCTPHTDGIGAGSNYTNNNFRAEIFNVLQPCTLVSVLVYANGAGNRTITLEDANFNVLQSAVINVPAGTSTVTLNFPLTVGTGYQLGCGDGSNATDLYRNTAGAAFPYNDPDGFISITGNNVPDNVHYYFFYNWKLEAPTCTSARTPIDVIITGGPTASFTYTQSGNTITFTNTSTGATTYEWHFGDGDSSNLSNPVHTYLANGNYTVTLTSYNINGCNRSSTFVITIVTTGINSMNINNDALSIYPNPTEGLFNVAVKLNLTEQVQLTVTDILGQKIYEASPIVNSKQLLKIDLSQQAKGIYFIQLKTNEGSAVKKLIIN